MTKPQDNGGPAFPSKMLVNRFATEETAQQLIGADGMSLRDWFAGMAMPAVYREAVAELSESQIASDAYRIADAMLAARKEGA